MKEMALGRAWQVCLYFEIALLCVSMTEKAIHNGRLRAPEPRSANENAMKLYTFFTVKCGVVF